MQNKLREMLFTQYATHYQRANKLRYGYLRKDIRSFKIMYGKYLESLPQGSLVLDVGCGNGYLLQQLSIFENVKPIGVDISKGQIDMARTCAPKAELTCIDALEYLDTHTNSFSIIFCMDVLEHLESNEHCFNFVKALRSALVPGGLCIVRTPNAANLTGSYSRYMDLTHERSFTRTSLIQLLEAGGFQNTKVIPVLAEHLTGRMRLTVEYILHRLIFLICGKIMESVFTSNVIISGCAKY